jgi:glycosyltransferase involved in cell wall biosynthesis
MDDIFLVGGGIGGLATALALGQNGVATQLFEQGPAFTEVGAGIGLGPNAVRRLQAWGLRQALQANYNNDDVIWWGYEADQAVRLALLQVAEVFMLPSLVEGLSLALLEAMASGTACVATDAGADGEVLEGGAGIVISTQGVTTQLRTLLPVLREQPILSRELGRRARERVLERYTLKGNIDALEQLYTDLISPIPLAA